MRYQLADLANGPFGDVYETLAEAEKELAEKIAEGQAANDEWAQEYADAGQEAPSAADFFSIVEIDREKIIFTEDIDDDALREAIEAIEENNRISDTRWNEWDDAQAVADTYGIELCAEGAIVIDRAIKSNGASLAEDLPAVERAVFGDNFYGSFWSRES